MGAPTQNGLYSKIRSYYAKKQTKLFTTKDIEKQFNCAEKSAKNAMYVLHRQGSIFRHIDKKGTLHQYAFDLPEDQRDEYVRTYTRTAGSSSSPARGVAAIQKIFANIQNQLSHLEDLVVKEFAAGETIKKQKKQVARLMRHMKSLEDAE